MLTDSTERFTRIQNEASSENQNLLVQVTKCQEAKHCKVRWYSMIFVGCWVMGKKVNLVTC